MKPAATWDELCERLQDGINRRMRPSELFVPTASRELAESFLASLRAVRTTDTDEFLTPLLGPLVVRAEVFEHAAQVGVLFAIREQGRA